jgi:hypothetical protein
MRYAYRLSCSRCPHCDVDLTTTCSILVEDEHPCHVDNNLRLVESTPGSQLVMDLPSEFADVVCAECDGDLGDHIEHEKEE